MQAKAKMRKPTKTTLPSRSLIRQKSERLMQARSIEAAGRFDEAVVLYQTVARDEEKIARHWNEAGKPSEAAVNQISAASCWKKAGDHDKAIRLLDKVLATEGIHNKLRWEVKALRQEWIESFSEKAVPDSVLSAIAEASVLRDIERAMRNLNEWRNQIISLSPLQRNAVPLLAYFARGIDFESSYLSLVERVLPSFQRSPESSLTLLDSAHLETAEGLVDLHRERYDEAIAHFTYAMNVADHIGDADLMTVSRYYSARCYWKKTNYNEALRYIRDAKAHDRALKHSKRWTAIELVESWLLFLMGEFEDAKNILEHAESELKKMNNYIDLGNALSSHGRFARQEGKYDEALQYFSDAITQYQRRDPNFRNIARCHTNMAFVYRLKARELAETVAPAIQLQEIGQEINELRLHAFNHLTEAERIYNVDPERHHRGNGRVHEIRALLHFDVSEFDRAELEAEEAYCLGKEKDDHVVMANAKIIQCMVALETDRWNDARPALKIADRAVALAKETENRRLQARAYIWRGRVLLEPPFNDPVAALEWWDAANDRLSPQEKDYLREDLKSLKKRIDLHPAPAPIISCLTPGRIAGRSLEEIIGGVEKDVVRYVYEQTGRKINQAAKELRTAPRRVKKSI